MCFVWIWEQTAIISLYNINWLVFITETESVHCAVRTGYLYTTDVNLSLQSVAVCTPCHVLQSSNTCNWRFFAAALPLPSKSSPGHYPSDTLPLKLYRLKHWQLCQLEHKRKTLPLLTDAWWLSEIMFCLCDLHLIKRKLFQRVSCRLASALSQQMLAFDVTIGLTSDRIKLDTQIYGRVWELEWRKYSTICTDSLEGFIIPSTGTLLKRPRRNTETIWCHWIL